LLGDDFEIAPGAGQGGTASSGSNTTTGSGTAAGGATGTGTGTSAGGASSGSGGMGACPTGFADCNNDPADGCEAELDTDAGHCGACDRACSTTGAATLACTAGLCTPACATNFGDCTQPAAPTPDDGCETATGTKQNCATCGNDCLEANCVANKCEPFKIADADNAAQSIAIDQTHIYWTDPNGGQVARAPFDGTTKEELTSWQLSREIALDATYVFFTNNQGGVRRMVKAGASNPDLIYSFTSGDSWAITTQGGDVYAHGPGANATAKIDKLGGGGTVVDTSTGVRFLTSNATHVYWTTASQIERYDVGTGMVGLVVGSLNNPTELALDATHVYWADGTAGSGSVLRIPHAGGTIEPVVQTQANTTGLAIDATHVYFTNTTNGTVDKAPIAGGPVVNLASGFTSLGPIEVDDEAVYFPGIGGAGGAGAIWKVAK
jgi:hypothetical protein